METAGILAKLGLNNSQFRAGLKDSIDESKSFERGWKDIGKLFAAGGVTTAVIGFFNAAIEGARASKDELDQNVQATRRFGDSIDSLKGVWTSIQVAVTGTLASFGEWVGRGLAVLRYGEQHVKLTEQIEKQTRETLATIEKEKQVAEDVNRIRAQTADVEKKATEEANKQLAIREQIAIAGAALQASIDASLRTDGDKVAAAKAELQVAQDRSKLEKLYAQETKETAAAAKEAAAEKEKDHAKFAKMNEEFDAEDMERMLEKGRKENEQAAARSAANILEQEQYNKAIELMQTGLTYEEAIAAVKEKIVRRTEAVVDAETERIKKLLAAANAWLGGMGTIRGGAQFNDLDDAALEEIARRNRQQAADATNPALVGTTSARANMSEAARLQFEADNAEAILASRNALRQSVRMLGVEGARSTFGGDPMQYDTLVQRWVTDSRSQSEILRTAVTAITDINTRLSNAGLRK